MGRLYMVATPIGNLDDVSERAARVLRDVPLVVAEDTRQTRRLLNHLGAAPATASFHAHSPRSSIARVLTALAGGDVAYVSDAGTPAISDPGPDLVRAAVEAGHDVIAIPGPSAVAAALSVSGFPADSFLFLGFLPRKSSDRQRRLRQADAAGCTLVLFEAPHRLAACFGDLLETLGDRRVAVCRELTKLFEETFRGTVSGAIAHFAEPRGEFVIVVEAAPPAANGGAPDDAAIARALERLAGQGIRGRRLVDAAVADTGAPRSTVYRLALAHPVGAPPSGRPRRKGAKDAP